MTGGSLALEDVQGRLFYCSRRSILSAHAAVLTLPSRRLGKEGSVREKMQKLDILPFYSVHTMLPPYFLSCSFTHVNPSTQEPLPRGSPCPKMDLSCPI